MPVLVDPRTGERYENVPEEEQKRALEEFGLVPLDKYEADQAYAAKPIGERAAETGRAFIEGATRPLEGLRDVLEESGIAPKIRDPYAPEGYTEQFSPSSPEALARAERHPVAATAGDIATQVAAGAAVIGAAPGVAAGLAGEFAVGGGLGELGTAARENRPPTLEGAASQGAINVLFAGAGLGAQRLYRSVAPKVGALRETAQKAYRGRVSRAGAEDLADPEVARDFLARNSEQTAATVEALDEAVRAYRPAVANNPVAQRDALKGIADGFRARDSAFAEAIDDAMQMPRQDRFRELLRMREDLSGEAAEALDDIIRRPSLWGDKAVAHAETLAAARGARGADPATFADAIRSVDDDGVRRMLGELDEQLGDATAANAAQAFRPARPRYAGAAAADGGDDLTEDQLLHYLTRDDELVRDVRELAGGAVGSGERGAVQRTFDSFDEVVNNATKREDFAAATPTNIDTRRLLDVERAGFADEMVGVAKVLDGHSVRKEAAALRGLAEEIKAAPLENVTGMMDQAKQLLDRIHLTAITNKSEVWKSGDILKAVDPVVERVRKTLQNPQYVGPKIAEIQEGRNLAWSDPETGFIHNIQIAERLGVKLMKGIAPNYKTGRMVMEFDPSSIKQLLQLDEFEAEPVLRAWSKVLDSMELMAKRTVEAGARSAGRTPVGELLTGVEDMRSMFTMINQRLIARRRASEGLAGMVETAGQLAERLPLVGDVVKGSRQLGALKTAEGAAKAKLARPVKVRSTEEVRARIRNLTGAAVGVASLGAFATDANAAEYLQTQYEADLQFTARAMSDPVVAAEYARRNKDKPSTIELFQGPHATPEQAYMEMRASVQSMRQDPMGLIEQMAEGIGDVPEELRAQLASKAFEIAAYLEQHLPPLRGVSITRPNGLPPSSLEVRTFALRYMAATDPSTVFDDAKRGKLRHEQVQTLQAVWPQHYSNLRMQTLLSMGDGRSTVQQRQRADLLFGFGAALDPAFSPQVAAAAQAAREAQRAQAPAAGSAPSKTRISGPLQAGGLNALSLGAAAPAAQ